MNRCMKWVGVLAMVALVRTGFGSASEGPLELRVPERIVPMMEFQVGRDVDVSGDLSQRDWGGGSWSSGLVGQARVEAEFVRGMVVRSRGWADELLAGIEVDESERPWSSTNVVHVPLSVRGGWVPYVALARENHTVMQSLSRFGIGGGGLVRLGRSASAGMEALYLGNGDPSAGEAFASEMRVMGRLQIGF